MPSPSSSALSRRRKSRSARRATSPSATLSSEARVRYNGLTMKLAAIQFKPVKGDVAAASEELAALVEQAATQGAKLVVCPEMATSGYLFRDAQAMRPYTEL